MKDHIFANENVMCGQIQQFALFTSWWISQKYTFLCSRTEFVFVSIQCGCISKTSKDSQVSVHRRFLKEDLKRCNGRRRKSKSRKFIYQVGCCENTFTPIFNGNMRLKEKTSSYIQQMLMFSFHPSILLWSLNTRVLSESTILTV